MSVNGDFICDFYCSHEFFSCKKMEELFFCKKCGTMKYKESKTCKISRYSYSSEFDQLEGFSQLVLEDSKIIIDYESDHHKEFINSRTYILNYMKNLMMAHNISEAVYFMAVQYLDLIMLQNPNFSFLLATYACFLLASKFYENDPKLPSASQIEMMYPGQFSAVDVKRCEMICLKLLGYKLNRISSYDFLEFFLKNGIVFEDEVHNNLDLKQMYNLADEILIFFSTDNRYLDFTPLQVSCAIVSLVREKSGLRQGWSKKFSDIYKIKMQDFKNCYFVLKTLYSREIEIEVEVQIVDLSQMSGNYFSQTDYCEPHGEEYTTSNFSIPVTSNLECIVNNNQNLVSTNIQHYNPLTPTNLINYPLNTNSQVCRSNYSNYQSEDSTLNNTLEEEFLYYPVNRNNPCKHFINSCNNQSSHFNNQMTISPFNFVYSNYHKNRNYELNLNNYYNNY